MDDLLRPPRLRPGATIGVAAISGPVDETRLDVGLARLREKGYRVVEADNLRDGEGFLAGEDAERAGGYRRLLCNPGVDAVFFARGGYGAARILSRLDPEEVRSHPKIHLGGSDLTALFAFLQIQAGLVAFYGPMVAVEMAREENLDWESVLAGGVPAGHEFGRADVLAPGRGSGILVGGCLSLLASLAGTPEAVRARGSILFWEDVGEQIYRLDRLLTQLERSGTFEGLQGMVIGSVIPAATDTPESVRDYLRKRFADAPFPVALGFPGGHLDRPRTLPLGSRALLDLRGEGLLSFPTPAVA